MITSGRVFEQQRILCVRLDHSLLDSEYQFRTLKYKDFLFHVDGNGKNVMKNDETCSSKHK